MCITKKAQILVGFLSSLLFITPLCAEDVTGKKPPIVTSQTSEITKTIDANQETNNDNTTIETETIDTADIIDKIHDMETTGAADEASASDTGDNRLSTESTLIETFVEPTAITDPSMLIIDASVNMTETFQNVDNLTVEAIIVSDIASLWSKLSPLGLMSYGNKPMSDCNAISLLQPIDTINIDNFHEVLKKINPQGESPYIKAVQTAAKLLDHRNNKANIILISGGKDSCNIDPCATVRALKKESKNLTAHVISFNTPEEDTEGLRCLAQETNGIFLEVTNPDELKIALNEIRRIVTEKSPLKFKVASVSVTAEEEIIAGSTFEVNWEGPENSTDKLVIKPEAQENIIHYQYLGNAIRLSPSKLIAPEIEGTYEIHYMLDTGETLAKTTIEVVTADASIDANKQMLASTSLKINWTGPKNLFDKIAIFDLKTEEKLISNYAFRNQDQSPSLVETPDKLGRYEIRYLTFGNRVLASSPLTIVPAIIRAPDDEITSGSVFNTDWVGPKDRLDNIAIFDLNNQQLTSKPVFRIRDVSPVKLTAPGKPGEYQVRYQTENHTILAKQNITVIAATASIGADGEIVAGSAFNVNWMGPDNAGDTIALYNPQTHKRHDFTYFSGKNVNSPAIIAAPETPGNYEVRYISNNYALASQPVIVIPATATINAVDLITTGYKFYVNWTGPENYRDMVAIFDTESGKHYSPTYIGEKEVRSPATLTAPMTAGIYEIRYYTKGGNTLASQTIQVINEVDEDDEDEHPAEIIKEENESAIIESNESNNPQTKETLNN